MLNMWRLDPMHARFKEQLVIFIAGADDLNVMVAIILHDAHETLGNGITVLLQQLHKVRFINDHCTGDAITNISCT